MSAPAKTMVKPMTLAEAVALLDRAPVMGRATSWTYWKHGSVQRQNNREIAKKLYH
jgi:hypothetical protein